MERLSKARWWSICCLGRSQCRAGFFPAESLECPTWDSQASHHHSVPRAWIISQHICCLSTSYFIVSSQNTLNKKVISAYAKAAGKAATTTALLEAMPTWWLLQWDADFILEWFFFVSRKTKKKKNKTQQPQQKKPQINPQKIPLKPTEEQTGCWNGQDCYTGGYGSNRQAAEIKCTYMQETEKT